jgi:hypothetical protein
MSGAGESSAVSAQATNPGPVPATDVKVAL